MSNNAHILPNDNNSILPTLTRKAELNIIITNKDGTPDHLAINIYYDSLRSWYNPMKQYQADGNVLHIKKLKTQGIYSRAEQLATIHGVSKETIRKKLVKLEKLRLIQRSFKHKFHSAVNTYNQRIIYVLKDTPHFFNPHGIDREEIKELIPQTNAEYIAEKYNVIFAPQTKQNKLLRTKGGIHTLEDTKELIEPFSKEKDRSNESNFSVNAYSLVQSKSNSFNNSNFLIQSETSNLVETEQVVKEEPKPKATLHILKPNKTRPNKRRKPTKAQQKAGKAKLLRFRQYTQPQDLTYHYPLTAEDASELQSKSTRYFSLNAQNQILLSMSNKPSLQGHRFASKAQFMAYM